jgi:hypothetical protein
VARLFAGWRQELATCRKFAPAARNYAAARLMAEVGLRVGALGRDHRPRDAQPDHAVDGGPVTAVLDDDLVAEEGRRLGAGVRDQRLVLVEFQLEVIAQELCEALLDLLGFGLGSGEPEEVILGLCRLRDRAGRDVNVLARALHRVAGAA